MNCRIKIVLLFVINACKTVTTPTNKSDLKTHIEGGLIKREVSSFEAAKLTYFFKSAYPLSNYLSVVNVTKQYPFTEDLPKNVYYAVMTTLFDRSSSDLSVPWLICFLQELPDVQVRSQRSQLLEKVTPFQSVKCVKYIMLEDDLNSSKEEIAKKVADDPRCFNKGYSYYLQKRTFTYCIQAQGRTPRELKSQVTDTTNCNKDEFGNLPSDCILEALGDLRFEAPTDDIKYQSCTCGVDITEKLQDLKNEVIIEFNKNSPAKKGEICKNIFSENGWDIYDLAFQEGMDTNSSATCGHADSYCSATVTVGNQCFWAGDVNYLIWGLINKICHSQRIPGSQRRNDLATAKAAVFAHRFYTWFVGRSDDLVYKGRINWTQSGWDSYGLETFNIPLSDPNMKRFGTCLDKKEEGLIWRLAGMDEVYRENN